MKYRTMIVTAAASGLALGAAACGSTGPTAAAPATAKPSAAASSAMGGGTANTSSASFGPGCASVPASGAGSLTGMSAVPVATAASHNPLLSTLVAAVTKAGLATTLNSVPKITVFAPDNAAFAKLPKATLASVLANKAELTKILTYHVASGRITPAQLAAGTPIKTLEGGTVTPAKLGSTYEINSSHVVCGNVQTANATVYIIDTVLTPAKS